MIVRQSAEPLDVQIGLARPEELNALWDLYQSTFLDSYVDEKAGITEGALRDFLATNASYLPPNWLPYLEKPGGKRTVYVARRGDEVVGMISPALVDGRNRITALYVAPELQGQGIGTKLMQTALSHYGNADVCLGAASHIERLLPFYESFGFKVAEPGKVKRYPNDPISYVEMVRPASIGSKF